MRRSKRTTGDSPVPDLPSKLPFCGILVDGRNQVISNSTEVTSRVY